MYTITGGFLWPKLPYRDDDYRNYGCWSEWGNCAISPPPPHKMLFISWCHLFCLIKYSHFMWGALKFNCQAPGPKGWTSVQIYVLKVASFVVAHLKVCHDGYEFGWMNMDEYFVHLITSLYNSHCLQNTSLLCVISWKSWNFFSNTVRMYISQVLCDTCI